jgi:hypothetical protein
MTEKSNRFSRVQKDPRFRRPARKETKIQVDDRFKGIFNDPKFTRPYSVDKYGRKVDSKNASRKEMEKFYKLDEVEESKAEESDGIATDASIEDDFSAEDDSASAEDDSASASSSDSESDNEPLTEFSQHPLISSGNVELGDATRRLAIVNVDWDQLKAVDLYVLVHAFKPPMGQVKSVKIFPSEFGKERIEREAIEGPPKEIFALEGGGKEQESCDDDGFVGYAQSSDDDGEDCDPLADLKKAKTLVEESGNFDQAALRRYQLERLRYYYAVVECDSMETAAAIYHHCDGREFETSTNNLDLRYIPDSVSFDESEVTDCATAIPKKYIAKPALVTDALQRSSVKLTWDQDDPDRRRITRVNPGKIDYEEADLRAYIASDSDSNGDSDAENNCVDPKEERIARYRALLLSNNNDLNDGDDNDSNVFGRKSHADNDGLDITFTSALHTETESERVAVFDADGNLVTSLNPETEETTTKKNSSKKSSTTTKDKDSKFVLQKEWSKKSDVKKMRKKESDLVNDADDFTVNLGDSRFTAVYDSPAFAIDPTAPAFKKTKGMAAIIDERQRRRRQGDELEESNFKNKKKAKKISTD